jgi:hypothetical protein
MSDCLIPFECWHLLLRKTQRRQACCPVQRQRDSTEDQTGDQTGKKEQRPRWWKKVERAKCECMCCSHTPYCKSCEAGRRRLCSLDTDTCQAQMGHFLRWVERPGKEVLLLLGREKEQLDECMFGFHMSFRNSRMFPSLELGSPLHTDTGSWFLVVSWLLWRFFEGQEGQERVCGRVVN